MNRFRWRAVFDQRDLVVVLLFAALAYAGAVIGFVPVVRAALAVPLVLFLPGYALVNALFPALVIPAVERILLSIGASIAVAIVVGLVLGLTRIGLNTQTWSDVLVAVTIVLVIVAWLRRIRNGVVGPAPRLATMPLIGLAMVIIAALAMTDIVLGTRVAATQQESPPPAALWMVPVADSPYDARLGVRADATGGPYSVVLSSSGTVVYRFDLNLTSEQTWETIVTFTPELRAGPIIARLYVDGSTTESRYVILQAATNSSGGLPSPSPAATIRVP